MNILKHIITIIKHKNMVWYFGRRLGIKFQAFFHDMSKFHPIEFFESVKYYSGKRSPIDACKEVKGYSKAWFHHRGNNPHHYEYWVDSLDIGGIALDMPNNYKIEMLCDYLAAAYTYTKGRCTFTDEYNWWISKSAKPLKMHANTRKFLNDIFEFMHKYFGSRNLKDLDSACWKIIKSKCYEILKV